MEISLERRIDRLEARAQIAELCCDYCTACDDRDMAMLESCFTEDVRFQSGDGKTDVRGRKQTMEMFNLIFADRGPGYHWTHDRKVTFHDTDPDIASGLVLAHAETTPHGVPSIAGIRYNDCYRRVEGKWKIAERQLTMLYYLPMRDFIDRFPTELRIGLNKEWREADFPETLATWQAYYANDQRLDDEQLKKT